MCPECDAEYRDPLDRRFHAQPVACPECGPHVWLEMKDAGFSAAATGEASFLAVQQLLAEGKIVAIKGLGGFHLACDATNTEAVSELRARKLRVDKPFALMAFDLAAVEAHCYVSDAEVEQLESRQRPVVLLQKRSGSTISAGVAPGQSTLGFMLPYTPLHYLLFAGASLPALVMTSGNLSEEPIATGNDEARQRLASLADAFLMHDRPIHTRCDDSVVRVFSGLFTTPIRRSRGFAPFPVKLPMEAPPLLAVGAELKNTFCITRQDYAFLSHHIGDLENYETLRSFEDGAAHFERLFRVRPEALAYDLHPNYLASRYALERSSREGIPAIGVQHHHAHIAACMLENGLAGDEPVIGVAFDGTGYGLDGAIWGSEFLVADYSGFERSAHLEYIPLPGGDRAAREPWRIALAWLHQAGLEWSPDLTPVAHALHQAPMRERTLGVLQSQITHRINSPLTSSMGRLFDAVSALAGVRQVVNYEGQAAIELEALIDSQETGVYPFDIRPAIPEYGESASPASHSYRIDPSPMFHRAVADIRAGVPQPVIAARFHNGLVEMVIEVCQRLRQDRGIRTTALSGGVWQNSTLFIKTLARLERSGFTVALHRQVPANDGGLALGQAAVAIRRLT